MSTYDVVDDYCNCCNDGRSNHCGDERPLYSPSYLQYCGLFCQRLGYRNNTWNEWVLYCRAKSTLAKSLSTMATKVAENGNKSRCFRQHLLPFLATISLRLGQLLLPFSATIASATICRRFRQLLSPVWTGYKDGSTSPSKVAGDSRINSADRIP